MSGLPYMRFFTTDYRADPGVQRCTWAARGLWVDMLCIMHENGGYLSVGGVPLTVAELARMAGGPEDEAHALLAELERAKVFSRDDDGTIYSRRIVRDIERSERGRETGKLGGNPILKGGLTPPLNPNGLERVKGRANPHARVRSRPLPESEKKETSYKVSDSDSDPKAACGPREAAAFGEKGEPRSEAVRIVEAAHLDDGTSGKIIGRIGNPRLVPHPVEYAQTCVANAVRKRRKRAAKPEAQAPPDSVPSHFVRQGSDEWQRLKARTGHEPIVTMHHGNAGTWVRTA